LVPGQRAAAASAAEARAERNVSASLEYGSQDQRQLRRAVAVISVEKNDHIGILGICQPRQTSAPISSPWFLDDSCPHSLGEMGSSVRGIAVDNDDLRDDIARQIAKHTADGLRFVMCGNDDRYAHAGSLITTMETQDAAVPAMSRRPRRDLRVLLRVRAMRALEPVVPKSMTCPILRPKGGRGRGMRQPRLDA